MRASPELPMVCIRDRFPEHLGSIRFAHANTAVLNCLDLMSMLLSQRASLRSLQDVPSAHGYMPSRRYSSTDPMFGSRSRPLLRLLLPCRPDPEAVARIIPVVHMYNVHRLGTEFSSHDLRRRPLSKDAGRSVGTEAPPGLPAPLGKPIGLQLFAGPAHGDGHALSERIRLGRFEREVYYFRPPSSVD